MSGQLSPKQKMFCELYAQSGNATLAAREAGYSEKYANREGCRLLDIPRLAEYIHELARSESSDRIATAVERQEILTSMLRNSEADPKDRLRAIEILGRAQGDFIDRINVTGPTSLSIIDLTGKDNAEAS